MFKPTIEIASRNELRHGIPVRFLYRGFTVSRLRTGDGMCFWSACKGGSGAQANPDRNARQAAPFRAGKDSAQGGVAALQLVCGANCM